MQWEHEKRPMADEEKGRTEYENFDSERICN